LGEVGDHSRLELYLNVTECPAVTVTGVLAGVLFQDHCPTDDK